APELADHLDHGPALVDLAQTRDAQLVPAAIAEAVGVQESGAIDAPHILRDLLHEGSSLLVLDNFEQVMDAALFVADLLAACPGLRVLVTSREALGVRYEQVYEVAPLGLPEGGPVDDLATAAQTPALAMFQERARARRAGFTLTRDNVGAVADIC